MEGKNKKEKKSTDTKRYLDLMTKFKTDVLFVNDKDEIFTSRNLAELSVKDKKDVKELKREVLELKTTTDE